MKGSTCCDDNLDRYGINSSRDHVAWKTESKLAKISIMTFAHRSTFFLFHGFDDTVGRADGPPIVAQFMGVLLRPMSALPDTSRQLRTYLNQAKIP